MAFPNKYPGSCGKCGSKVQAFAGLCEKVAGKYTAFHKSCGAGPRAMPPKAAASSYVPAYNASPYEEGCATCGCPEFHDGEECPVAYDRRVAKVSTVLRTSSGTYYRNARGKCEDAPCCGCCTF